MRTDRANAPAYRMIQEDIVSDILGGIYIVGSCIRGQEFYAKKFSVSRTTVRKAIDELVERGLLYTIRGKGTYVKSRTAFMQLTPTQPPRPIQPADAPHPAFKLLEMKLLCVGERIARQLDIAPNDTVLRIKRVKLIDEVAANYQSSYLNLKLMKDLDFAAEDLENGSLYSVLIHKAKLVPSYSDELIRAVECPAEVAPYFNLHLNAPILLITRVTYCKEGAVMEYCEDYECTSVNGLRRRYTYEAQADGQ